MTTTLTDRITGAATIADPASDLEALEALTGTGLVARTGSPSYAVRTLTAPAAGITVTNGDGVSGNPTLVLANDLAALEALATTGLAVRTGTSTWTPRTLAVSGTGISIANATGVGGDPTITIVPATIVTAGLTVATQSDQETSTSITAPVTPGRQQYHPSAAKCWVVVTVSAGTPTMQTNYNITSIADTATGNLTVTIATDFSTANWACVMGGELVDVTIDSGADIFWTFPASQAAGTVVLQCYDNSGAGYADPLRWSMVGFGINSMAISPSVCRTARLPSCRPSAMRPLTIALPNGRRRNALASCRTGRSIPTTSPRIAVSGMPGC